MLETNDKRMRKELAALQKTKRQAVIDRGPLAVFVKPQRVRGFIRKGR